MIVLGGEQGSNKRITTHSPQTRLGKWDNLSCAVLDLLPSPIQPCPQEHTKTSPLHALMT